MYHPAEVKPFSNYHFITWCSGRTTALPTQTSSTLTTLTSLRALTSSGSWALVRALGIVLVCYFQNKINPKSLFSSGMRYALQTLKIAIIHTVRKYKLVPCDLINAEDKLFFSMAVNGFVGGIKFKVESLWNYKYTSIFFMKEEYLLEKIKDFFLQIPCVAALHYRWAIS